MVRMNDNFYLERVPKGSKRNPTAARKDAREWWLVKPNNSVSMKGQLQLTPIVFPKHMIGKRIRIKIEIVI